jgi:hypothetical protein
VTNATRIHSEIRSESASRRAERLVVALAARQHGVVSRRQLVQLGLGQRAIDHRIAGGRLHPLHRGVYAVGHPVVSRLGTWMAATLAAGDGAALSDHTAATVWGIRDATRARPSVIAPRRVERPRIDVRHIVLPADEVTIERGLPVTTPARTLFDLAATLTAQQLEAAANEAEIKRLTSPTSLAALLARYPRRPGAESLRRLIENRHAIGRQVTRSELEVAFLAFLDAHALPRPRTNVEIDVGTGGAPMVDAAWDEHGLIVELDSYGIHATRRSFEADRDRDRALTVAGWRVVRITWRRLHGDAASLATELRALLRTPGA